MENQEDFPCLICGRTLIRVFTDENQPNDGIGISTHGNYGSTVWDDMEGQVLAFNICDSCIIQGGEQGRIFVGRYYVNVQADTVLRLRDNEAIVIPSIVGSMRLERPFVPWHKGIADDGVAPVHLSHDELISYVASGKVQLHGGLQIDPHILAMKAECEAVWAKKDEDEVQRSADPAINPPTESN